MELRKCKESREIEIRNAEIRQTGRGRPLGQNAYPGKMYAIQAISRLPAEQKKIWNTYRPEKKGKILDQVDRRVNRRLSYAAPKISQRPKPKLRREALDKYRQETSPPQEYFDYANEYQICFPELGQDKWDYPGQPGGEEAEAISEVSQEQEPLFQRNKKQGTTGADFRDRNPKTMPFLAVRRNKKYKNNKAEKKVEQNVPSGEGLHNQEQTVSLRRYQMEPQQTIIQKRKGTAASIEYPALRESGRETGTKRSVTDSKGRAEIKKEKQLYEKKSKLYRRELGQIINQETRRTIAMKQQQRELQIEQTLEQRENQMRHLTGVVLLTPAKLALSPIKIKIGAALSKAANALSRYALMAGFPLLLLFILFQAIVSSVSGLMAEEQSLYGAAGQEIVAYAEHWIGVTKYVLGAGRADATDWQDYTDCSGFTHGVFAHFGYEIGSYTGSQQHAGELVEINSLESAMPGDIILFYKNGVVDDANHEHAAIYAGDGNMIHCAGGAANYSIATAGPGVVWGTVLGDGRPWMVRRIVDENFVSSSGEATGGYRVDSTPYTQDQIELIWAIVAQEDNGSYEGALAVISSAMNRTESPNWTYCGSNALEQLTAAGQYCYSNDDYWRPRLGGNVPNYVKQAVSDCLERGIRNHEHTSFRSQKGSVTGPDAVQIGGNWFFGN